MDFYFDFTDYQTPIKSFLNSQYFYELEAQRVKKVNFYVMKSQVTLQDDYFQLGQSNSFTFAQNENAREYDNSNAAFKGMLVSFYVRFDPKYELYERKIYAFLQMLGDIGGL